MGVKTIIKNCELCSKPHTVRVAELNRGFGKYCSRVCSSKARGSKVEEELVCTNCKVNFKRILKKNYENRFCSRSCSVKYLNKTKKPHKISKKGLESIIKGNSKRALDNEYYKNPKLCIRCMSPIPFSKRKQHIHCSMECRQYSKPETLSSYRTACKFKFSLNDFPLLFNFKLIELYGWYSPKNKKDNLEGVSRDHKFSVRAGYELGISPDIISHPANCRLMKQSDNFKKKGSCSITLSRLIGEIEEWDIKYLK